MILGIIIGSIFLLAVIILVLCRRVAPPDVAYIVSGLRKRVVIGKATVKLPILERLDKLSLRVMSVDVKTGDFVPTNDYMNVKVDGIVKVQIPNDPDMIDRASRNFLNQPEEYIIQAVQDVLEGNMREIVGQMKLTDMVQDRKRFGELVQENAVPDLSKLGLEIVSFNVQNFNPESNVIQDLGEENKSKIRKDAAIAKAQAEKEIAMAQARANKEANDAEVESNRIIAEKQNELRIREAELKEESDKKAAIAEAALQIQSQIERKKREEVEAEANLIKEQKAIEVQKAKLDAEKKQQADAMLYEAQRKADAEAYERTKQADAEAYERIKQADASKEQMIKEAEGIEAKGKAEAEAIRLKALAEAEGIDKKAEAMKKYGEAAILEMYFKSLPDIAKNVAEPLKNIDKITMYGEGNNTRLVGDITRSITQISDGLNDSLGVDVKSLLAGALGHKLLTDNKSEVGSINGDKQNTTKQ